MALSIRTFGKIYWTRVHFQGRSRLMVEACIILEVVWILMSKQLLLLEKPWQLLMKTIWYPAMDLEMVPHEKPAVSKINNWLIQWSIICFFYQIILAASTHDQDVFSFYPDGRFCNGFEEVLSRYWELVPNLKLAGKNLLIEPA